MRKSSFADRVNARMIVLNLRQKDVCQTCGLSQAMMSHICRGVVQSIDANLMFRLADALKCNARWLTSGEGDAE